MGVKKACLPVPRPFCPTALLSHGLFVHRPFGPGFVRVSAAQMLYVHIMGHTTLVLCDFLENRFSGHSALCCQLSTNDVLSDRVTNVQV